MNKSQARVSMVGVVLGVGVGGCCWGTGIGFGMARQLLSKSLTN